MGPPPTPPPRTSRHGLGQAKLVLTHAVGAKGKYTQINGRIENIQPDKSFDVVYFGSKEFTERYVRKDNVYMLAAGGASRVQRC